MAELDRISRPGQRGDLAVSVIGGGATGVEIAGTLADLRIIALPVYFPEIDRLGGQIHPSRPQRDKSVPARRHAQAPAPGRGGIDHALASSEVHLAMDGQSSCRRPDLGHTISLSM